MSDIVMPPRDQILREETIRGGMDLMFFSNTRHLRHADETLAALGLGRAHHRILYFVARQPGINVTALLAILGITKQSFGRVAKQLITKGLMEQHAGARDRRQRLMMLTAEGAKLEKAIFDELHDNVARAYTAAGPDAVIGAWIVMQHLMGEEARVQFRSAQGL
ncbi:MarR family winged helix-turn-helix transcriptional regulator [uncultured Sphingomonas sp.]|uniref:MarR family winged helix-turn-helix transcriptional regulator n=1 Tax=uncultured Sphingomonas sp. TaxID=158754 RepID=UPI0025E05966|nr:MarR family winged helix-turn-helix transcriptional regulator [uncultured Sphingomonas sp.]